MTGTCLAAGARLKSTRLLRSQGCACQLLDQAPVCGFRVHRMALVGFRKRSVGLVNWAVSSWTFQRLKEAARLRLHYRIVSA